MKNNRKMKIVPIAVPYLQLHFLLPQLRTLACSDPHLGHFSIYLDGVSLLIVTFEITFRQRLTVADKYIGLVNMPASVTSDTCQTPQRQAIVLAFRRLQTLTTSFTFVHNVLRNSFVSLLYWNTRFSCALPAQLGWHYRRFVRNRPSKMEQDFQRIKLVQRSEPSGACGVGAFMTLLLVVLHC